MEPNGAPPSSPLSAPPALTLPAGLTAGLTAGLSVGSHALPGRSLVVELGMGLARALLREADGVRAKNGQLPPPLDCALLLQQLPGASVVSPSTWLEVLRSVALLLDGFTVEAGQASDIARALQILAGRKGDDTGGAAASGAKGAVAAAGREERMQVEVGGATGEGGGDDDDEEGVADDVTFQSLPPRLQLALLRGMCDALLQTEGFQLEV